MPDSDESSNEDTSMTTQRVSTSAEIRQQFLDFFRSKDHLIVPSASLVPVDDPTLLFTNAGMNQFKDIFLGLREPDAHRVADSQKCMRVSGKHNDLEDVGRSPYHHTLFEMLGNWSFGDYYKQEALAWSWELLTGVWGLPKDRLWATVFEDDKGKIERDDEAAGYWKSETDIDPEHILFFGRKDNFWEMGETGPCGPCSEIHLDLGPERCDKQDVPGHKCTVNGDCRRFIELWNNVFIQYNRDAAGVLTPLPARHVDTGMGFERIVSVLQGAGSNYDTDLFAPIIRRTGELLREAGVDRDISRDLDDPRLRFSYRVIADHARAIAFLIGDGVMPANEGRGYVLRLILRRAARHGRMLGFDKPFLAGVAQTVIDIMGSHYDELVRRREFILTNIDQEESRFMTTLVNGLALLDEMIAGLKAQGQSVLPGEQVFRLYDTHGFPLDLTQDVALENDMEVDIAGFQAALAGQKERGRASAHFVAQGAPDAQVYVELLRELKAGGTLPASGVKHLIYEGEPEAETRVVAIVREGKRVQSARTGEKVELVLPETPFYVESGGQVADTGLIARYVNEETDELIWEVRVDETRRPISGLIVHAGEVTTGSLAVGEPCWAEVDIERRMDIMRNHTATHLLHSELRYILGEHVHQAGSVVAPDRLRFDFTHASMLTQEQIDAVEQSVNDAILTDYPVLSDQSSYREAVARGAMALFTEKYGDEVRVIRIGWDDEEFSKELCGGTHVERTGQIGFFHIVSEESVGSGIRRIEAVTGRGAQRHAQARLRLLNQTAAMLRVPAENIDRAVRNLYGELQAAQKEVARLKVQLALGRTDAIAAGASHVEGIAVVHCEVSDADVQTLRDMSDQLRNKLGSAVVVLAAAVDGKPQVIAAVTDDLLKRGLHAGEIVKSIARIVGGGGGGKPSIAQAGGRDLSKLPEALASVPDIVRQQLKR
jgi:alanyl-tRNA synthetase